MPKLLSFAVLAAAVVLNLSHYNFGITEFAVAQVQSASLASKSCRNLGTKLDQQDEAQCVTQEREIEGQKVRTHIQVNVKNAPGLKTRDAKGNLVDAPAGEQKIVEVQLEAKATCDYCAAGERSEKPEDVLVLAISDIKDINAKLQDAIKELEERAAAKTKQDSARAERIKRCEAKVDAKGLEVKLTGLAKLDCRVDRLSKLEGDEADQYFAQNIKLELQKMIQSRNSAHAQTMLSDLKSKSPNTFFIKSSIKDLQNFNAYMDFERALDERILETAMQNLNDPNLPEMRKALQNASAEAQRHFSARGIEYKSMAGNMTGDWQQSQLSVDLDLYRQSLQEIAAAHRVAVSPPSESAPAQAESQNPAQNRTGSGVGYGRDSLRGNPLNNRPSQSPSPGGPTAGGAVGPRGGAGRPAAGGNPGQANSSSGPGGLPRAANGMPIITGR